MVRVKRAYEPASRADGYRVLVDRLWPRGLTREAAHVDLWAKDLAPSPGLRTWFHHHPARFREFAERYRSEMMRSPAHDLFIELLGRAVHGRVTLVYASHDEEQNNAVVLKAELDAALGNGAEAR